MTVVAEIMDAPILTIPSEITNVETVEQLKAAATPFFEKVAPLCVKAREIVVTDAADKVGMKKAREVRLAIKDVRVEAEKKRKDLKEDSLRKGQAVDKIFNGLRDALSAHEEYLDEQETFAERLAAAEKARIKAERDTELAGLGVDPANYNTGDMTAEAFAATVGGIKAQREAERVAKEKAEQERIAREKAEAEERERVRIENEKLKAEAEARERAMAEERAKAEAERKAAAEAARIERERIEAEARVERERLEAEARKEREARERVEAEQRTKAEAERKRVEAEAKAAAKAARAPDKKKAQAFASHLRAVELFDASTAEGKTLATAIKSRVEALAAWIEGEASRL